MSSTTIIPRTLATGLGRKLNNSDYDETRKFTGGSKGGLVVRDTDADGNCGASLIDAVAIGRVLVSGGTGALPLWSTSPSLTALTLSTALGPTSGGTGLSTYAVGDLPYGSAPNVLSKLAAVADGNVLRSAGVTTAPLWGKVRLSGTPSDITGTLPGDKGGTGHAAYTVGDVLVADSPSTLTRVAPGEVGTVLMSNGLATAPSFATVEAGQAARQTMEEAANQTFTVSAVLVGNGSGFVAEAGTNPTAILGLALEAGHNSTPAGTDEVDVDLALPHRVFTMPLDSAGSPGRVTVQADLHKQYGLTKVSSTWTVDVDKTDANARVVVVGFVDPVGTATGDVKVIFLNGMTLFA